MTCKLAHLISILIIIITIFPFPTQNVFVFLLNCYTNILIYSFFLTQNVFYRVDFKNDARFANNSLVVNNLRLLTLLKTVREQEISMFYVRSKYIVWSRMVVMVSVHSVLDFIDNSRLMHARVGEEHALLHHYRKPLEEIDEAPPKTVRDRRMHHFADKVISASNVRHLRVRS